MTKEHATERVRHAMGKLMDVLKEYHDTVGADNLPDGMREGVNVLAGGITLINEALD